LVCGILTTQKLSRVVIKKEKRFNDVTEYLIKAECDAYIITEANAAIDLPSYFRYFHLPVRILIQTGGSHFLSSLCPS